MIFEDNFTARIHLRVELLFLSIMQSHIDEGRFFNGHQQDRANRTGVFRRCRMYI